MESNANNDNNLNSLVSLGLAQESESFLNRAIDSITRKKSNQTIITFAISQISFLCIMFLFTSTVTKYVFKFDASSNPDQVSSRRFVFNFSGLHFFHEFLALDLAFYNDGKINSPFNVTSYSLSNMYFGNRLDSRIEIPTKSTTLSFTEGQEVSSHIRIFSSKLIHYSDLESSVFFKTSPPTVNLNGVFIWSYSDPAYSIVLVFLRFLFFIIGLIVLIRFLLSRFDIKYSHASIRLAFYLILFIIICSDPLYILTYFAESYTFKIIDTVLSLSMLFVALFGAYFSLMTNELKHTDVHKSWIGIHVIPYLIGFGVFAASSLYANFVTINDPFAFNIKVIYSFSGAEIFCLIVYLVLIIIRGISFTSEAPNERFIAFQMSIIMMVVIFFVEFIALINKIPNKNIYLLIPSIIYALFFIFLNWPVDTTSKNNGDMITENPEDSQAPQESLASQLE